MCKHLTSVQKSLQVSFGLLMRCMKEKLNIWKHRDRKRAKAALCLGDMNLCTKILHVSRSTVGRESHLLS